MDLADGEKVQVPLWLQGSHPMSAQPAAEDSLVDYRVPADSNVFYSNMMKFLSNSNMGKAFTSIDTSNILVLGSSGNVLRYLRLLFCVSNSSMDLRYIIVCT